jgi:hypothetical protein
VPPAASRNNCCIDPWPLAPADGGRRGGEATTGKKTTALWGRRRPTGVKESATVGPTSLLQGAAGPRGDGERWRPSSTRQMPPSPARARSARGRRRRPSPAGTPLLCFAPAPREDEAPLPLAPSCSRVEDAPSPWSTGISAAPRELRSRRPNLVGRSDGALQPCPPGKDMVGSTSSQRGARARRWIRRGAAAGEVEERERGVRGGQRLGCSVPRDARAGDIVAFCSKLCGSRWSRYSAARICKPQM